MKGSVDQPTAPRTKPLLRGVSHQIAAGFALLGWALLAHAAKSPQGRWGAHVYGASLFALFAISASYHRPTWSPAARAWMRRLDHSAIFILIAGTYTPLCLLLEPERARTMLLIGWGGAALGVLQSLFWVHAPRPFVVLLYLILGWLIVFVLPTLGNTLGTYAIWLVVAGGVVYSIGGAVYARRAPDPFPKVFGYHEIFHALVIAAALLHFGAAAGAVLAL
jgi:hemolysin III